MDEKRGRDDYVALRAEHMPGLLSLSVADLICPIASTITCPDAQCVPHLASVAVSLQMPMCSHKHLKLSLLQPAVSL